VKRTICIAAVVALLTMCLPSQSAVPQRMSHQGVVAVNGQRFNGTGTFYFSLIANGGAGSVLWANNWNGELEDPAPLPDGRATAGVQLSVADGVYSANLGGGTMKPIPPEVFNNGDVVLRIWFKDAPDPDVGQGIQQLQPDQELSTAPFAIRAFKSGMAEKLVIPGTETDALVVDANGNVQTANLSLSGDATVDQNLHVGGVFNGAKGIFVDFRAGNSTAGLASGSTNWVDVFVVNNLDIPAGKALVSWTAGPWSSAAGFINFRMVVGDAISTHVYHHSPNAYSPETATGTVAVQTSGGTTIKLQAKRCRGECHTAAESGGGQWSIGHVRWTVIVFRD
jgi:hypothetical protein